MQSESTVHIGNYGDGTTREKQEEDNRGIRSGKPWHSSLNSKEITEQFIIWGIVGRRRQINPVVRLMPHFDRGPGFAA